MTGKANNENKAATGRYRRQDGRVIYELTTPDPTGAGFRIFTLYTPTLDAAYDKRLATHLVHCECGGRRWRATAV